MARARVCTVIPTPAEAAFKALVDWGNWGAWAESLKGFKLESGAPGMVGSVRVGQSGNNAVVRERLTSCDEANFTVAYVVLDPAPFPARDYAATVRLLPLSDGSGTVVEWVSTFIGDTAEIDEKLRLAMEGHYRLFIDALASL